MGTVDVSSCRPVCGGRWYTAGGTACRRRIYKVGHWGSVGSLGQVTRRDRSNRKG
jgi:hypothetical protein